MTHRGGLIDNPTGTEYVELSGPSGQVTLESIAELGGGGGGTSNALPAGDAIGTIDSTTYDNTATGVGKARVLRYPTASFTEAFAIARQGEAFPRLIITSDGEIWFGDGTFDPISSGGGNIHVSSPFFTIAAAENQQIFLTDVDAQVGTGNGIYYSVGAADGDQRVYIQVGDSGQFSTQWAPDGTVTFPGTVIAPGVLAPGVPIVRKFPFAYNTPNILTGVPLFTGASGDQVLHAYMQIDTAFNGTSPTLWVATNAASLGTADIASSGPTLLGTPTATFGGMTVSLEDQLAGPVTFKGAHPVTMRLDDDDLGDPGSTQGAAILYLVTVTPV